MGPTFRYYRRCCFFPLVYESRAIKTSDICDILIAKQDLHENVQLEERLYNQVKAFRKAAAIETYRPQLKEAQKQLEKARRLYPKREYDLYQLESLLRLDIKADHNNLRCDDTWFMREGLVQDCSRRGGGCCSRQCGCCAQRHRSSQRNRGAGHCTVECGCCISFRGFDLPQAEKEKMREGFLDALSERPSQYLLNMTNWFFCPVRPQGTAKKEYWWQRIFRPAFIDGKVLLPSFAQKSLIVLMSSFSSEIV